MIGIGSSGSCPPPNSHQSPGEELRGLLLACHQRIRRFSSTALRLLETPEASDAEISDAAQRVFRYFTVAFPLHVLDEDESIKPRLKEKTDPEVLKALEQMSAEHTSADQALEILVPAWEAMISTPQRARETEAKELVSVTQALIDELEGHLKLEEELIFPRMLSLLSDDELAAILGEFRERRKNASLMSGPKLSAVVGLSTPS